MTEPINTLNPADSTFGRSTYPTSPDVRQESRIYFFAIAAVQWVISSAVMQPRGFNRASS